MLIYKMQKILKMKEFEKVSFEMLINKVHNLDIQFL